MFSTLGTLPHHYFPTSVMRSGILICTLLTGMGCQPDSNSGAAIGSDVAGSSATGNTGTGAGTDTGKTNTDEQLWLTPPKGWVLESNIQPDLQSNIALDVARSVRHLRYLDPQEPSHSLTIETRNNATLGSPAADPLQVLEQLAEKEQQDCRVAEDFNTFTGVEYGFGTTVRLFICAPTTLTSGRITLLKIIQGQQQTYLVALQHQWSKTPDITAQDSNNVFDRVAVWSMYMRGVRVCAATGCPQQDS